MCYCYATFFSYTETQFNVYVKQIRNDNAKELCKGDTMQLLIDKGIHHQKSCPKTPQQNGVVECKHRYLIEKPCNLICPFPFGVRRFKLQHI